MARRGASIRVGRIHRGRGARPTWENLSFSLCPGWSTRKGPIPRRLGFNYGPRKSSANHAKMPTGGRCFSGRAAFRDSTSYAHCSSKDRPNREQGGRNGYPRPCRVRFAGGLARDEPFDGLLSPPPRVDWSRHPSWGLSCWLPSTWSARLPSPQPSLASASWSDRRHPNLSEFFARSRTDGPLALATETRHGRCPDRQGIRAHAPGALRHDRTCALSNSACIVKRAVPAGLTA